MIWLYVAQEMTEMQSDDSAHLHVMTWKLAGVKPEWKNISSQASYWARFDALELKDNALCRKWESECEKEDMWLIILPKKLHKTSGDRVT